MKAALTCAELLAMRCICKYSSSAGAFKSLCAVLAVNQFAPRSALLLRGTKLPGRVRGQNALKRVRLGEHRAG